MNETECMIKDILNELGLTREYKGYYFLFYGLILLSEHEALLTRKTNGLYKQIADHYDTKVANVERNIRTACRVIWDKNKNSSFFKGHIVYPSNGMMMDLLLNELEKRMFKKYGVWSWYGI